MSYLDAIISAEEAIWSASKELMKTGGASDSKHAEQLAQIYFDIRALLEMNLDDKALTDIFAYLERADFICRKCGLYGRLHKEITSCIYLIEQNIL